MDNVAKIERWVGGVEIALIIIAIIGVILTHVMCWIDFVSFLISTGAFLAFGVVAFIPSASAVVLEKKLAGQKTILPPQ